MSATQETITSFVERLVALREAFKGDVQTLAEQAKAAEVDMAALRRLASWMGKSEVERAEQDALDDQYRFLAGMLPAPAELPPESEIAKAAALYADKMTIRAVAKEMRISVGKAHALKIKAAAFTVHPEMNVNSAPAHDPETGEVITPGSALAAAESERPAPAPETEAKRFPPGSGTGTADTSSPALAAASDDLTPPPFLRRSAA
jgi:uncharacterized protein (UPF0335 family)